MVCKKCGTILKVNNSICSYCGFNNSPNIENNVSNLSQVQSTLEKQVSSDSINTSINNYNNNKLVKIVIFVLILILIVLISFKIFKKVKYNQSYYYNIYDGCSDLNTNIKQVIKKANFYYVLTDDNNLFYYKVTSDNNKYKINECKKVDSVSSVKKIYTDDDYIYLLFNKLKTYSVCFQL